MAQISHAEGWKEDIPPDQQRLDEEIRELEALQRNVAQRLRCARAKRACAVAQHCLQQAERELRDAEAAALQMTEEDDVKISLNPSAPTDCKVVHITKAMRKRARRRLRQLEVVLVMPEKSEDTRSEPDTRPEKSEDTRSEKTLELEPESKEPEPETALRPFLEEMPKPPEGLVQQRIASFEVLAKAHDEKAPESNEALQPVVDKLEPDKALEPVGCAGVAESSDDGLALAHASVDAETPAEALLADTSEDSSDDAESYVVHQFVQDDVKLEPADELEPEAQVAQDEHHGSSPHSVASNGVGAMSGDELTSVVKGMPAELEDKAQVIRAAVPRIFSPDWAEEIIKDARSLEVQNPGIGLAFLTYMAKDFIEAQDAPT